MPVVQHSLRALACFGGLCGAQAERFVPRLRVQRRSSM